MAKVPLRKYNSEIEALIDRGQTDEAVAHCRHILKTFPKHLETYRMLGKAYLETKRYAEATDIFKRVLTAVPDDFVSHVGLSIIADDKKRLDDAIWHMERAFESQPSNAAIQSELQRLYGRRDGMEPPKIRLTRGALAHMYVQGELYAQAIGEIRSVLAEDPNRTDMQVLLALAYFRSGQKVEASEVCTQLIGRFPYCLDANRVLMEILPGTGLAESIQTYRQRVMELDPYAAHATGSIFLANETQDSAVNLDRLEYKGQPVESGEWGQALGIGLGAGAAPVVKTESIPPSSQPFGAASRSTFVEQDKPFDFPKADAVAQDKPFETPRAGIGPAAPASGEDALPEWMRDAGWGASTGAFDESASSFDEATEADDLPKAILPDWIKSMAPAETQTPPIPPPASSAAGDDTMDWLNKLSGDKPFESDLGRPFSEPVTAPAERSIGDLGTSAAEQDAGLLWLEGLAAKQGAKSEELITNPAERLEKPPEWVEQAKAAGESQPAAPMFETTSSDSDELAKWLSKLDEEEKPFDFPKEDAVAQDKPFAEPAQKTPLTVAQPVESVAVPAPASPDSSIGDLGTSAADQDAAMLWLEGLAAKQGAKSEELITNPAERLEKPPEWVEQAKAAGEPQPAAPVPAVVQPQPPSEPVLEKGLDQILPSELTSADQTGVWLRELDEKDKQAEVVAEAPQPDWSGEIEFAPPPAAPEAESAAEVDLPTWLRGIKEREAAPASSISDEMPEWLRGDEPEVPAPPEPTRPADWMPEASMDAMFPVNIPEPKPEPRKTEVRKPQPKSEAAPPPDKTKVRRTGMLPPLIDPNLALARDALSRGKIPDALQAYSNLIRKGKLLEDITFDLKEALYRFPVEVSIWQVLGDAYMRANRLQDALDAYTKAEELLR